MLRVIGKESIVSEINKARLENKNKWIGISINDGEIKLKIYNMFTKEECGAIEQIHINKNNSLITELNNGMNPFFMKIMITFFNYSNIIIFSIS